MYNEYFLEGYYDALNETSSIEARQAYNRTKANVSKSDVNNAKKVVTALGAAGVVGGAAGAAGGTAFAIRQGKKIANYSTRLGELKKKKDSGKITPQELKEYKKLIAKTALSGAIGVGSAKYAVDSVAGGAAIAGGSHKLNKKIRRTFGESYEEAFLEGYDDALNEIL
jgi:hypothetical protein